MKKKLITLTMMLIGIPTLIIVGSSSFLNKNIAALAALNPKPFCYIGGPGATSCSIEGGINIIGYGISGGCSITCRDGYYACCSIRCTCEVEYTNSGSDSDNDNLKP